MQDPTTVLEGILAEAEEAATALAEDGKGELETAPVETPATKPSEKDPATPAPVDGQPASEVEALLDLLDEVEQTPSTGPALGSPEFWAQQVQVGDGDSAQTLSITELVQGNMRQSDYTRKTQEVARDKEANAQALDFFAEFNDNPEAFFRKGAIAAGWIKDEDGKAVPNIPGLVPSGEVAAQIAAGIDAAVDEHPDVKAATQVVAERAVDEAFAGIETKWGVKLDDKNRERILIRAQRAGTTDLDMVMTALMYELAQIAKGKAEVKKTAGVPAVGGTPDEEPSAIKDDEIFTDFDQAWKAVEQILGDSAPLI